MSSALHAALYAELVGTAAIAALIGAHPDSRLWRAVIPQRVKAGAARYPCLVVSVSNTDRQVANCGTVGTIDRRVTIDCYGSDNETAWALAHEVRRALIDFRGMLGGTLRVRAASLESEGEIADLEPGTYRVMQSWQIWHREE